METDPFYLRIEVLGHGIAWILIIIFVQLYFTDYLQRFKTTPRSPYWIHCIFLIGIFEFFYWLVIDYPDILSTIDKYF